MPASGNSVLDALRANTYYSLLFPLLLVTTFVAVYLNWVAMKFFRHN